MAEESVPTNPGLPYSFPPFKAVPIYRYTFVIQVMLVVELLHLTDYYMAIADCLLTFFIYFDCK